MYGKVGRYDITHMAIYTEIMHTVIQKLNHVTV